MIATGSFYDDNFCFLPKLVNYDLLEKERDDLQATVEEMKTKLFSFDPDLVPDDLSSLDFDAVSVQWGLRSLKETLIFLGEKENASRNFI